MHTVTSSSAAARRAHTAGGSEPHQARRPASTTRPGRTLTEWWHFAAEYLLMLPVGAAIALVWVNTDPERYFTVAAALDFWVRDLGMALFFGLITKEVVEATAAGGVFHPWRRAAAPMVASLGLTLVPLALFVAVVPWLDEPRVSRDGRPSLRPTSRSAISRAASSLARIRRSPSSSSWPFLPTYWAFWRFAALGPSPASIPPSRSGS